MGQKAKKRSTRSTSTNRIWQFFASKWLFPAIVLLALLSLTTFKISGSSIGIYYKYFYGIQANDPSLLYGKPQAIRSDEWLVSTQLTIAQSRNDFHRVNENINEGRDMSVLGDAPYLEWSTIFKPQNVMFYILPLEFAFAFKWWFILALLLLSSYAFFLKLKPDRILFAVLASVTISFSPFIFWWYQAGTLAAMAYAFLLMYLSMSIIDAQRTVLFGREISLRLSQLSRTVFMAYILISFALLIYPPFQIPLVIVITLFVLGYLLQSGTLKPFKFSKTFKILLPFMIAGVISVGATGIFFATRLVTIKAITDTTYPGKRIVKSGGMDAKQLFVTYLQPQLQRSNQGAHYIENQSESSNFIILSAFFLVPGIILSIWLYIKQKRVDWILALLNLCNLIFLAHLFLPLPALITRLTLLHYVPFQRLVVGLGLLGIILLAYTVKIISEIAEPYTRLRNTLLVYTAVYGILALWAGFATRKAYPLFISNGKFIFGMCLLQLIAYSLLFIRRYNYALLIFALMSVMSVFRIHPLYKGLGPIADPKLSQQIKDISRESDTWGVVENLYIENVPTMSDRQNVTGVEFYPNVNFWAKYTGQENNTSFNRYAHVQLTEDQQKIKLVQPDYFLASISCQQPLAKKVTMLMSSRPLTLSCVRAVKTINYPSVVLYLYRVIN